MKLKAVATTVVFALAGCATGPEGRFPWEAKPVLDIRHGMANGAAYYQMGRHKEAQGDLTAAEADYEKALAADPKSVETMNALGALYARRGETERAATLYRRAADLSPQSAHLYNNIGYTFYLQGRYAEAVDSLRRAVTIDPGYRRAWVNLEAAARKAGMADLAASAARQSLGNTPAMAGEPPRPAATSADTPSDRATAPSGETGQGIRLADVPPLPPAGGGQLRLGGAAPGRPSGPIPVPGAARAGLVGSAESEVVHSRIEISNGNGVTRYASGVAKQLRDSGIPISRVTNFPSFNVGQTYIEYRPSHAGSAQFLRDRLHSQIVLKEAKADRPGTDIRLVLGADQLATPDRITRKDNSRPSSEG